ncbi:MAG TPA: ABC transporter substrate-binding protein [Mycobacteriales bacterium]|nr:ABC transporter substrate-binding protein [Mycobacteriales bacterium]
MRTTQRLVLALLAGALASSACGARLTSDQRADALAQGGSTGGAVDPGGSTGLPAAEGATGAVSGPVNGSTGGTTTGTTGTAATTGTGTTGSTTGGQVSSDWSKVPAGGNGGATDVGVTATTITVANVSDVTGAVPGLFEDARFAVQAYVKYFNARYPGGIYGRRLAVQALDSQLDTGAARSASIQACNDTFAGVGSISAFDQGAAPVIAACKSKGGYYPDIRGLATTDQMKAVPNAHPMNAAGVGDQRSFGQYGWLASKFPQAIKKAVFVYSDGEVTRQNAKQDMEATTNIYGFTWVDEIPVATTETNYAPAAQQIKNAGAEYVTFVGAYQQAANLAKAMAQFQFKPTVYMPTVTAYTPNFLTQSGTAVDGGNVYLAMPTSLLEERSGNPELSLYAQWLQQVKPGALPTSLGQFAWGAAALFVQETIKVGPSLTRGALLARLKGVHAFSPNHMYPDQDVGGRRMSDCVVVATITNHQFVRYLPAAGFRCQDGVYNLNTKKRVAGYPK